MFINESNLSTISRDLARKDEHIAVIFERYGPPPLWGRPTGFVTLLKIILEQQVSLASAKACFDRLSVRLGEISPFGVLSLSDPELKTIGFSRQKAAYARHLADVVINGRVDLDALNDLHDDAVRSELIKLKGIGQWTADIYLLMAMLRPDIMPRGDIALHSAWHKLSGEAKPTSDQFLVIAERWRPFRSVAARFLWHFYLSESADRKAFARNNAGQNFA